MSLRDHGKTHGFLHSNIMHVLGKTFSRSLFFILSLAMFSLTMPRAMAEETEESAANQIKDLSLALQKKYGDLLEVKLNRVTADVKFRIIDMRKSMVVVNGKRYCAFRFKTGDQVNQLTWCFRYPPGLKAWYILPEKGTMQGFYTFNKFVLSDDEEDWGSRGDMFAVQSLPSTHFKPNTGYIIWFQITDAADSSINLSLNMTNVPDHSRYSAVFPSIKL